MGDEIDGRTAGKIIRAAKDKAEEEIPRAVDHPCTIVSVSTSTQFPGGYAIVHVDGDPAADTREIPLLNGVQVGPGDRAFISYGPPWGAVISASMFGGIVARARASNQCFGGGTEPPPLTVVFGDGDEVPVGLFCDEVTAGGARNVDPRQIIARAGTYAVSLTATFRSNDTTNQMVNGDQVQPLEDGIEVNAGGAVDLPLVAPAGGDGILSSGLWDWSAGTPTEITVLHELGVRLTAAVTFQHSSGVPTPTTFLAVGWQRNGTYLQGGALATFAAYPVDVEQVPSFDASVNAGDVLTLHVDRTSDSDAASVTTAGSPGGALGGFVHLETVRQPQVTGGVWLLDRDGVDKRLIASTVEVGFDGSFSLPSVVFVADEGDQLEFRVAHDTGGLCSITVENTVLAHVWLAPAASWAECMCGSGG